MNNRPISRVAVGVAIGTMLYLFVSVAAFGVRSAALGMILLPGLYLLLAPVPILARFGMTDGNWLIQGPTTAGYVLLICLYTAAAYFLTRAIEQMIQGYPGVKAQP
jgi:hypothetical protein